MNFSTKTRRTKAAKPSRNAHTENAALDSLRPSPENDEIYRPVDPSDPEIIALAASIREHGLPESMIVTRHAMAQRFERSGKEKLVLLKDAVFLAGVRNTVCDALQGIDLGGRRR